MTNVLRLTAKEIDVIYHALDVYTCDLEETRKLQDKIVRALATITPECIDDTNEG